MWLGLFGLWLRVGVWVLFSCGWCLKLVLMLWVLIRMICCRCWCALDYRLCGLLGLIVAVGVYLAAVCWFVECV